MGKVVEIFQCPVCRKNTTELIDIVGGKCCIICDINGTEEMIRRLLDDATKMGDALNKIYELGMVDIDEPTVEDLENIISQMQGAAVLWKR